MNTLISSREQNIPLKSLTQKILFLLMIIQPLMDMFSYFLDVHQMSNRISLVVRMLVLILFVLYGFLISDNKKIYLIGAALILILIAGHIYACFLKGYRDPIADLTNLARVIQMPFFALAMISSIKKDPNCYQTIQWGVFACFLLISFSVLLSLITGTYNPTYQESRLGVLGWFSTSNAQSNIMSILVPLCVLFSFDAKKPCLYALSVVFGFAQLYLLGTRLAFFTIAVTVFGLLLVMILTKTFDWKYLLFAAAALLICLLLIRISPMVQNQQYYNQEMSQKTSDSYAMFNEEVEKSIGEQSAEESEEAKLAAMRVIYRFYNKKLSIRFGVDRVMKAYNYTMSIPEITGTRNRKILFCSLLMDEHSPWSRIFGMEIGRMKFQDQIYDVENDFHGIYFLYGWYGLGLILLFLGYFVYRIVRVLVYDFKKYFTIGAGAVGMAFCISMIYAYNTAGVLRRPNSSFYLSILLAMIFYLTQLNKEKVEKQTRD